MTNIGPSSVTLLLPGTPTEGCPDQAVTEDLPARGGGLQGPPPPPAGGRGRGAAGEHWAAEQQVTRGSDRSPGPAEEQVQAGARYQYQVKLSRYRQTALPGAEKEPSVQTEEMLIKKQSPLSTNIYCYFSLKALLDIRVSILSGEIITSQVKFGKLYNFLL